MSIISLQIIMFRFSFFYRFTVCFWSAAFNFAAGAQRSGLLSVVVRPPFRQALPKKSVFSLTKKLLYFFLTKKPVLSTKSTYILVFKMPNLELLRYGEHNVTQKFGHVRLLQP